MVFSNFYVLCKINFGTMLCIEKEQTVIYQFKILSEFGQIEHFVTTRLGGVSEEPYKSLNLGYGTGDFSLHVLENRHRMAETANIPLDAFVMANQVHGLHVEIVTQKHRSCGALYKDNSLLATDGMLTNEPELCLFVMGADCVPLIFYDPINTIIGAAHAGWRGTVHNMAGAMVKKMIETFNCNPANIRVGIGPSIGPCCYQVGEEVENAVIKNFGTTDGFLIKPATAENIIFDLWFTNRYQLLAAGIHKENIETSGICTLCNQNHFFSSRGDKGITGRFGAGIMLC
jgi:polyphenol oxidase